MNKIKTVLKDFLYFLLKNKKIIIFIYSLIFITFGVKLIYSTISIDTEHALSNYNSLIDDEWLGLNRYSLRFFKMTIFPEVFNPFLMTLLTYIAYGFMILLIIYIFGKIRKDKFNKFIVSLVMIASPVAAEFFVFDILSFEMVLCSILAIIVSYILFYQFFTIKKISIFSYFIIPFIIFITITAYQNLIILFAGFTLILAFLGVDKNGIKKSLKYIATSAGFGILGLIFVFVSYKLFSAPSSYFTSQIIWLKDASKAVSGIVEALSSVYLAGDRHFTKIFLILAVLSMIGVFLHKKIKVNVKIFKSVLIFILFLLPIVMDILLGQKNPIRVYFPIYPVVFAFYVLVCFDFCNNKKIKNIASLALIILISISSMFKIIYISNLFYSDYLVHKEDISFSQRIISKLDSMNFSGEYYKYDLVIINGRSSGSTAVIKGDDVLTKSIYEWGVEKDISCRAARLMNVLGYQFNTCDNKGLYSSEKIKKIINDYREKNLNKFPAENGLIIDDKSNTIIVNLKDKK